jgi:lipopolysaccharide export system protein LptA
LCLLLLGQVVPALALTSDQNQPIRVTSDRMTVDERKGISHYEGDVFLKQGSLEIRADTLTVHLRNGKITKVIVTGTPARLQQQPDDRDTIHSSARRMEYDTRSGQLLLIEDALVKQGANRFSGARIEYNTRSSVVAAERTPEDKDGRVHAIIAPTDKQQDDQQ